MVRLKDLPEHWQKQIREERTQARALTKAIVEACQAGDVDWFSGAVEYLVDNNTQTNWPAVFRQIAQLRSVPESIQHAFQLLWVSTRLSWKCPVNDDLLDALRVLFIPYKGSEVRLYRGARAYEVRRKFYGASWSSDIEEADWFARHWQTTRGGTVVLETPAPPEAITAAPGIDGAYFSNAAGERLFDEDEYLVDGRRLGRVTVARRYPEISLQEWEAKNLSA